MGSADGNRVYRMLMSGMRRRSKARIRRIISNPDGARGTVAALVATEREIPATNDGAEDVEEWSGKERPDHCAKSVERDELGGRRARVFR